MITKRSIGLAILFTIITCGIYGIYWMVVITDDTNKAVNDPNGTSGGIVVLLSIITCGIYGIYWAYKQGEKLDNAKNMRGIPSSNSNILYLVLDILGLSIIAIALMQDSLNKISDYDNFNGNNGYNNGYTNQNGQGYNSVHQNNTGYNGANYNSQDNTNTNYNNPNNNGQM